MKSFLILFLVSVLCQLTGRVVSEVLAFKMDRFYIVRDNPSTAARDKGLIGVGPVCVEGSCPETTSLLVWTGPTDNIFKTVVVKSKDLDEYVFDFSMLKEKTVAEMTKDLEEGRRYAAYHYRELTEEEKKQLQPYSECVTRLGKKEQMLDERIVEKRVRLIGASLCHMHGREALFYISKYNKEYRPYIEAAWSGICGWHAY